jgi:3-hydroxy-9,10-secoandrosta-1,3,5(10)-triene-9,17-dione monooxygenase
VSPADKKGGPKGTLLEKGQEQPALTLDEAKERAQWLADRVRGRRTGSEEPRRLPDETIEDFVTSDLLRMNQARRWGGHELGQAAVVELVSKVAEGDGSSGWVFGLLASHFWLVSVFGEEMQNEMWGADPTAMMSSSFAARQSSVLPVEGGYQVSGRWPYSSGSPHCSWAMVGLMAPPSGPDQPPLMRWGIVPRAEYSIAEEWDTCALRGTASNTLVLDDVFIPEHRTVDPALILGGVGPGRSINPGSVFSLGFASSLGWYLGATALGSATQVARDFAANSATKISTFTGQPVLSEPLIIHVGTAGAQVEAARAIMRHRSGWIDGRLEQGQMLTREESLACACDATSAVRLCVDAVDGCMRFSGAAGLALSNPVQSGWRDVHGVAAHMGYNTDAIFGSWGRIMLDLPLPPGFF